MPMQIFGGQKRCIMGFVQVVNNGLRQFFPGAHPLTKKPEDSSTRLVRHIVRHWTVTKLSCEQPLTNCRRSATLSAAYAAGGSFLRDLVSKTALFAIIAFY